MEPPDRQLLRQLIACHSTPGDEAPVAALLLREWAAAGWEGTRHGAYAISARRPGRRRRGPRLLVCAHLDAPGFVVERVTRHGVELVPLGGIQAVPGAAWECVLQTRTGPLPVTLRPCHGAGERERFTATLPQPGRATPGDRACFAPRFRYRRRDGLIQAPFLDNRLGCLATILLARAWAAARPPGEVVLGATGCEEMGGFGAPVLARAVEPELVVCLDATYEAPRQNVRLGCGPVLTLTDASVLLSPAVRDRLLDWAAARQLPLQTEVYNYSGTDSRAFPHQGVPALVLPLLIPTRGNHSPLESACWHDLRALVDLVVRLAAEWPWPRGH